MAKNPNATTTSFMLLKEQRQAIDAARGDVSMTRFILRAVGMAVKAAGVDWPEDNTQPGRKSGGE